MTASRNQPTVTVTVPTPATSGGKPSVPTYWAALSATPSGVFSPTGIHAAPAPTPSVFNGGYYYPPAPKAGTFTARWSVENLPDPANYSAGYYWLGAPSASDGTSSIQAAARQWNPDGGASGVPAWHSFFPFKPSVTSHRHYLFGGDSILHPKGVNFNSHFIEHMWMDWGSPHRQPFTWLIAAMVTDFPTPHYKHYLLDSGRNPDAVGVPRLTAAQTNTARHIPDGLSYRNMMSISPSYIAMQARLTENTSGSVHARIDSGQRPKMFIGIFNGASSYTGAFSPGRKILTKGAINNNSSVDLHQYYVMGRRSGWLAQSLSSHLLVFEIRYWNKALNRDQLDEQYDQLSSRHQFPSYRGL